MLLSTDAPDRASPAAGHRRLLRVERSATVIGQGQPHSSMAYTPFGYSLSAERTPAFAGEHRANGIYMLGNGRRAYLCSLMRFSMPDQLGPFRSPDRHPYAYCLADPVNRLDRNGDYSFRQIAEQILTSFSYWRRRAAWRVSPPAMSTAKFIPTPMTKVIRLGKGAFAWENQQGLHLLAHGNHRGVAVGRNLLTPGFLANKIQARVGRHFSALHLYSCEAGIGNPNYLQRLADELKTPVFGSSENVFTSPTPEHLEGLYRELRIDGAVINKSFNLTGQKLLYSAENWARFSPK